MSRKRNCWDNSVAESFFYTLKTELTYHINYKTRGEQKTQYLSTLRFFITENEYILLMIIFHLKNMRCAQKSIKILFGKVLPDQIMY